MGIEAGKFFVSLGLTGAEKTVSGLAQVNDHFAGLKGISTEAKLAILGALAGLEQMVSMTGKFGNETMKTHQHLLVSIHDLQLYEAMATRAGAASGSMTSAFENIQQTFQAMALEGKVPQFMPTLMALIQQGGYHMSADDIKKWGTTEGGPVQFFELLRSMALNSKVDKSKLNYMIQQSGLLPQDIYDVNRMGAFNEQSRRAAQGEIVTAEQVQRLSQLNKEWQDVILNFEKLTKVMGTYLIPVVRDINGLLLPLQKTADHGFSVENAKAEYHALSKFAGPLSGIGITNEIYLTIPREAARKTVSLITKALQAAGYNVTMGKMSSSKVGQ